MSLPFLDLTAAGFSTRSSEVRQARAQSWCARTPFGIAVLRHRQAGLLLRDRRLRQGSHGWPDIVGLRGSFADFWRRSIIAQEGPLHKDLRRIAQAALADDAILKLKPEFERIASDLVATLPAVPFDIVQAFTQPFAGKAIARLLGLTSDMAASVGHDASRLGLAMGPDARTYEATANAACNRLSVLAASLLDDPPSDSFAERLVMASGATDRQTLIDLIVICIFGGVDTTRAQLAFAAELFAKHPEQWAWLCNNPLSIPTVIDEVIRLRPTTTWASREALETFELDEVTIQAGETVHILVHASATDPLTGHDGVFDIRRPRKVHFGFGGGAHHCLGHFVARTDMAAALKVWLKHWARLEIVGNPKFLPDSGNTSPLKMQMRVSPHL